uniref:F-box domain-containing protein n=2 Tax=Setaria viridis TaxID=4556 RepID=A0A4U6WA65_SETVI|nr:hypothetical protein SEVIR_1G118300v2 [Setaria viridis]
MGGKRKRTPRLPPDLMEEVVIEILVRLPVKVLVRCKSVSKAWRAIISDPIFIQAHLRRSASNWQKDPCFIISPQTLDYVIAEDEGRWPTTFSNHIRFYQWQQGNKVATFIHDKEYRCKFNQLHYFSHCDGLVLAPTDTSLYVFNPATRDAITLPKSGRNNLKRLGGRRACYCVGLGLDPRIGKYKVVQGFYWSKDRTSMGMEVCTIADDDHGGIWSWGKIRNDPPYLPQRCQTAPSINGYMFWRIAEPKQHDKQQPPRALLHLSLDDEEFGITRLPDSLDPSLDYTFLLDVLHGRELCLTASTNETMLTIWTLPVVDKGLNSPWERRYSINVSGLFQTMALPPCSSGIILRQAQAIYSYNLVTCKLTTLCEMDCMAFQGRKERKWKDLFTFDVKPYTESLVRITNHLC